jgi:hypothetical protein
VCPRLSSLRTALCLPVLLWLPYKTTGHSIKHARVQRDCMHASSNDAWRAYWLMLSSDADVVPSKEATILFSVDCSSTQLLEWPYISWMWFEHSFFVW